MSEDHTQSLFDALELSELEPEEQEEILLDLGDLIYKGSLVRFIEHMDEATREEFNSLLGKDVGEEEVAGFIQKHVPNADQIVRETVEELRDDILALNK